MLKQQKLLERLISQNKEAPSNNQALLKSVTEWQKTYRVFYDNGFYVLVYYISQHIYQITNKLDKELLSNEFNEIKILKNVTDVLIQQGLILNKQILFDVSNPQLYKIIKFAGQENIQNLISEQVVNIISILQKLGRENSIFRPSQNSPPSYNLQNYIKIILDSQILKYSQKTFRSDLLKNLQNQLERVQVCQTIQPSVRNNQNRDLLLDKYLSVIIDEIGLRQVETIMQNFIGILKTINFTAKGIDNLDYQYFGSSINGFGHSKSDVDLTLLTNSYVNERNLLSFINLKIIKYNDKYSIKLITGARIPLIKIIDKDKDFHIDLCINNILGTINTRLLKQYADLHPKISQCGILIKIWAKNKGLINEREFSSYAIILMFLYSMQETIGLPIFEQSLKNQLKVKRSTGKDLQSCEEFETNVYFDCEESDFKDYQQQTAETFEKETIESILNKFWRFYEKDGEYFKNNKIITILPQPHRNKNRRNLFQIQDPFDARHDPGERIMRNIYDTNKKTLAITNKFTQAIDLLKKKYYSDLFDKPEILQSL